MIEIIRDALHQRVEDFGPQERQAFREMAGEYVECERIARHEVAVRIGALPGVEAHRRDEAHRIGVLSHQAVGARQPHGGEILIPLRAVAFFEALLQAGGLRRHDVPLTHQQIDRVRAVAFFGQVIAVACGQRTQIRVALLEHLARYPATQLGRFDQEMLRIDRGEFRDLVAAGPETVGALVVLSHAQLVDEPVEIGARLRLDVPELRTRREDERRHCLAHELLGADVRVAAEIGNEPMPQTEGQEREAGLERAVLCMEIAIDLHVTTVLRSVPARVVVM